MRRSRFVISGESRLLRPTMLTVRRFRRFFGRAGSSKSEPGIAALGGARCLSGISWASVPEVPIDAPRRYSLFRH